MVTHTFEVPPKIGQPHSLESMKTLMLSSGLTVESASSGRADDNHGSISWVAEDNALTILVDSSRPDECAWTLSTLAYELQHALRTKSSSPREAVIVALTRTHEKLQNKARQQQSKTILSVLLAVRASDHMLIKGVGNCRAYQYRNEQLKQLTSDHTLNCLLNRTARSVSADTTYSNTLLTHLGQHDFVPNDEFTEIDLLPGDRVLLCTHDVWSSHDTSSLPSALAAKCSAPQSIEEVTAVEGVTRGAGVLFLIHAAATDLPPAPHQSTNECRNNEHA